jgi:hypothetical protein
MVQTTAVTMNKGVGSREEITIARLLLDTAIDFSNTLIQIQGIIPISKVGHGVFDSVYRIVTAKRLVTGERIRIYVAPILKQTIFLIRYT